MLRHYGASGPDAPFPFDEELGPLTDFQIVPADGFDPADLHAVFSSAFSDYLAGPLEMPLDQWADMLARQGNDLAASRVAVRDGEVIAFALVSPRAQGRRWRLGAMGAAPEARGSGAAPALLDEFIKRAADAGQVAVELECFARNDRALRLYKSRRFVARHELPGWTLAEGAPMALAPAGGAPVREVDRAVGFDWLDSAERRLGDLPLQVTRVSLAASRRPLRFFQRGSAQLVWSDTGEGPIQVHSLVDTALAQVDAQALLAAMRATRARAAVNAPPILREDLCANAFARLGFERQALHQLLMVRSFEG